MNTVRFLEVSWPEALLRYDCVDATPPLPAAAVGVRQYWATDTARLDRSTGVRQFMATAWYPANTDPQLRRSGPLDLLLNNVDPVLHLLISKDASGKADASAAKQRLESLAFRAQSGLEAKTGVYPILIFYPGGQCHRFSKAGLCESLASLGYVVFALDAPRDAPVVVFPDGRQIMEPMAKNEDFIWPRVADIRFLLDQLARQNTVGSLAGHLDLKRIGIFGGSRGGYLSNIMAVADERVKAAANMDGFLWGFMPGKNGTGLERYPSEWQDMARSIQTPVLRLQCDQDSTGASRANFSRESQDFGGEFIYAALSGFSHSGFAPTPWLCGPVETCLKLETAPDFRSYGVLIALLSGFFGEHLCGESSDWFSVNSVRPEVSLLAIK